MTGKLWIILGSLAIGAWLLIGDEPPFMQKILTIVGIAVVIFVGLVVLGNPPDMIIQYIKDFANS